MSRKTVEFGKPPVRIMLIDDDPDCRMLVRDALDETGVNFDATEAENGADALAVLRRGAPPDLIFLDLEMPRMDGLETLERIKSDPRLHHVPVVMMTGVDDAERINAAAELGANSYTVKPSDGATFIDMVRQSVGYWLQVHRRPARTGTDG
ncbi:MAG: response regulator [Planctomycetota bacterium]